jgi:hypothetical protein
MAAAFESIRESRSHKETISTGDSCTSRKRSDFPYHPQPIKPTRRRLSRSYLLRGRSGGRSQPEGSGVEEFTSIHRNAGKAKAVSQYILSYQSWRTIPFLTRSSGESISGELRGVAGQTIFNLANVAKSSLHTSSLHGLYSNRSAWLPVRASCNSFPSTL